MMKISTNRKKKQRGSSIVEVALLAPWIFFLFVGVFDMGFYAYAAICTQNAARAAAIQTATAVGPFYQSDALACSAALNELSLLPNLFGVNTCAALPVTVVRKTLCDSSKVTYVACTANTCADCSSVPAGTPSANYPASSQITVTYQSGRFIPIPGVLTNQLLISRVAEARIINE